MCCVRMWMDCLYSSRVECRIPFIFIKIVSVQVFCGILVLQTVFSIISASAARREWHRTLHPLLEFILASRCRRPAGMHRALVSVRRDAKEKPSRSWIYYVCPTTLLFTSRPYKTRLHSSLECIYGRISPKNLYSPAGRSIRPFFLLWPRVALRKSKFETSTVPTEGPRERDQRRRC